MSFGIDHNCSHGTRKNDYSVELKLVASIRHMTFTFIDIALTSALFNELNEDRSGENGILEFQILKHWRQTGLESLSITSPHFRTNFHRNWAPSLLVNTIIKFGHFGGLNKYWRSNNYVLWHVLQCRKQKFHKYPNNWNIRPNCSKCSIVYLQI